MPVRTYSSLLTLFVASACTAPSAELPPVDRLHSVLRGAVKGGPGTIVSLDTVIAGDWEVLYVFSPYTGSSHIRECVGARVPTRGIEANDGITLLVLAPTKGAAHSIAIPRDVSFARSDQSSLPPRLRIVRGSGTTPAVLGAFHPSPRTNAELLGHGAAQQRGCPRRIRVRYALAV